MQFRLQSTGLTVFLLLLAVSPEALAQSRTQVFSYKGVKVHVVTHVMTITGSRACNAREQSDVDSRAVMIGRAHIARNYEGTMREARAKGFRFGDPSEFLKLDMAISCLSDGARGVRFPAQGQARIVHFRPAGKPWHVSKE
ncbi:MAG: hypothetical protein J0L51_12990 [Rhizobiales bacterium]|nr:hypothetical protein [Hyphomicrobiales bacterium]